MGIIKAAGGSVGGVLADQWLEIYSCDGFEAGVLSVRGVKKVSSRSANTKGDENVISDGSVIIVNVGQCALAIERGQIIGCYDTPGENIYRSERSGSIFHRGGLKTIVKQSVERFGYGGVAAIYQVVMYLDLREHMGNPFTFRLPLSLTERGTGTTIDATLTVSGMYSFRITEPTVFYKNVCGCSTGTVRVSDVQKQLEAELSGVLRPAIASVCSGGITAYELSVSADRIVDSATAQISEKWESLRGFTVVSLAIENIALSQRDKDLLQSVEYAKALTNPTLAAAVLVGAQAQAMQDAASNPR